MFCKGLAIPLTQLRGCYAGRAVRGFGVGGGCERLVILERITGRGLGSGRGSQWSGNGRGNGILNGAGFACYRGNGSGKRLW